MKKVLSAVWAALKPLVLDLLRGEFIKLALRTIVKSSAGVQGWIVQFIAKYLFDEVGKPLIQAAFIEGEYMVSVQEGKILIKKLRAARDSNDQITYDDVTDLIFD